MADTDKTLQAILEQRTAAAPRLILFLTVFLDLLGFGIVIPFLPMFAGKLGIGGVGVGLILASYSIAQLGCAPVLGRISDRVGRRPVILLGLFGSSIGYLIYGIADSFMLLMVSRVVHGACAATVSTAQAYVADTTSVQERARGMGMIGAAFGLGFVLGPALGGLLGHSGLRVPVFFACALTFLNFVFAAFRLPESHQPDPSKRLDLAETLAPLLRLPQRLAGHRLTRLFAVAFLLTFALAALEATFALMIPRVYGYGAFGVGALLAFAGLMQAVAQGYLVGKSVARIGEARVAAIGAGALALGLAPLASLSSHALLIILLGMVSLGYGLASPSVASLISRSSGPGSQGEMLGVNQSALALARISGPIAGGLLYEFVGPAAPYAGGGIAVLAAGLLILGLDGRGF